jgi:hypothetical protein
MRIKIANTAVKDWLLLTILFEHVRPLSPQIAIGVAPDLPGPELLATIRNINACLLALHEPPC